MTKNRKETLWWIAACAVAIAIAVVVNYYFWPWFVKWCVEH